MIKKRKKAYSLMMVLICTTILIILGISVLSLTITSYNKRMSESRERRNQYFSEGGLDIAYSLIGKTIEYAIDYGNNKVQQHMAVLTEENTPKKEDGTIDELKIKEMQNAVFKSAYEDYIKVNIKANIEQGIEEEGNRKDPYIKNKNGNKPKVLVQNSTEDIESGFREIKSKNKNIKALPLELQSTFKEKSEKKLKVNYNILVPNYGEVYNIESKKVKIPIKVVWTKALCADGNLVAKGKLNVNGDIYIKGKDEDKEGGIKIDNGNCNFNGDVITPAAFQFISENNQVTLGEEKETGSNMYAGNVLFTKNATNSKLNVNGAVYTDNDLAVNSSKTNVIIKKGFYGLNDINISNTKVENSGNEQDKDHKKSKVSSSILVNTEDIGEENGSSITIGNELLLMGTAYIKTKPAYQTGESVAIKGNYKAYTYPLGNDGRYQVDENGNLRLDEKGKPILRDKSLNEDNVTFEYRDPLTIVTKFKDGTELSWQDKSDYFTLYARNYSTNLKKNGINLPQNKNTVGSGVNNGDFYTGNYNLDIENDIKEKSGKYGVMVYTMGEPSGIKDLDNYSQIYQQGTVLKKVNTEVAFDKIKDKKPKDDDKDIVYLNGSKINNVTLIGLGGQKESNSDYINLNDKKGRGIIITAGDVYLSGKIDFEGTIISGGDIKVLDNEQKMITYDKDYVKKLVAKNYDIFKNIFIGQENNKENVLTYIKTSGNNELELESIRQKLITVENWKLIK